MTMDHRTATFQEYRPRLYGIAYRMLGSRADAEDATWTADGGGKTSAARKVVQGARRIAKLVASIGRMLARQPQGEVTFHLVPINGETGIVSYLEGKPAMALSIDTDGLRILAAYNVLNPEKLSRIAPPETSRQMIAPVMAQAVRSS